MLESLFIKNIALIDEVHINFKSGLNILTGETGAGKSMIISAINFLRGRKIDKMNIRKNCDMALIEGTFSICDEIILKSLNDLGIDVYEDNLIIISRKYNLGKVVNRVNGRNVTVGMLREISDYLLEFHGQNENQKLLDSKSHLEILDRFCMKKILPVKEKLNMKLKELRESEKIVDKLTGQTDLDNKIMMLEFQIKEISNANLILGEEENLQARYKMLSNAKNLCEKMSHAMNLIYNAENCSAMDMISHANQLLNEIKNEDESQKNICDVIESVAINLDDVKNDFANALSNYEEILNNGMQEMREIEKRLDFLYELKTKYKRSVDEIIEYLSVLNNQYENLTGSSEKIKELEDRVAKLKEEVLFLCEQLSEIRKDYSKIICSQIEKNLFDLGMIDAKIQINFEKKSSFNENGFDDIQFLISTNKGEDLKPLAKFASGGEMSRIMLAIKAVFARFDNVPTLIFDEIDSGVSGRIAQMVGEKLNFIAREHQIICITHLVQIAAMADVHFLIKKISDANYVHTEIYDLNDKQIINELARLLSGKNITDATLKTAKEIKKFALKSK
jgi:DNA repair protein RecN